MLQRVAVAVCFTVSQRVAVCCRMLQYHVEEVAVGHERPYAVCCSALQCVVSAAGCCSMLQRVAVCCSTTWRRWLSDTNGHMQCLRKCICVFALDESWHTGMSHGTYMKQSWNIWEYVMAHTSMWHAVFEIVYLCICVG